MTNHILNLKHIVPGLYFYRGRGLEIPFNVDVHAGEAARLVLDDSLVRDGLVGSGDGLDVSIESDGIHLLLGAVLHVQGGDVVAILTADFGRQKSTAQRSDQLEIVQPNLLNGGGELAANSDLEAVRQLGVGASGFHIQLDGPADFMAETSFQDDGARLLGPAGFDGRGQSVLAITTDHVHLDLSVVFTLFMGGHLHEDGLDFGTVNHLSLDGQVTPRSLGVNLDGHGGGRSHQSLDGDLAVGLGARSIESHQESLGLGILLGGGGRKEVSLHGRLRLLQDDGESGGAAERESRSGILGGIGQGARDGDGRSGAQTHASDGAKAFGASAAVVTNKRRQFF